jgi:hypothetical protein
MVTTFALSNWLGLKCTSTSTTVALSESEWLDKLDLDWLDWFDEWLDWSDWIEPDVD